MIEFSTAVMPGSACNPRCTESHLKGSFVCKTENGPQGMYFRRRTTAHTSHSDRVDSLVLSGNCMQRRGVGRRAGSRTSPLPRADCRVQTIWRSHPHGCEAITVAILPGFAVSERRSALLKPDQADANSAFLRFNLVLSSSVRSRRSPTHAGVAKE